MNRLLLCGSIGLALSITLLGQGKPGGVPAPVSPTPTRTTTPTQPSTTQPSNTPQLGMQRPIYISGKVALDDGTPPPEPVTIEMICGGNRHNVGYTDSKGRFSIDLTNRIGMAGMADASESNNRSNPFGSNNLGTNSSTLNQGSSMTGPSLIGCDLRAALPGFRSDQANLGNHRSLDNPDVGTIILHRMQNVEGLTISATSAMAPPQAKKAFEKGRQQARKGKLEDAERELEKAVEIYPAYASAWFDLGQVQQQLKNVEGARKSYAKALAADSKFVSPYQALAGIAARESKWDEVLQTTERLLHLNAVDFPQAWFYNALAKFQLRKIDDAEKAAREGLTADSAHRMPKMDQLLGVILAEKRDFPGATEHLQAYLKLVPDASDADIVKKQLAEIDRMKGPEPKKEQ